MSFIAIESGAEAVPPPALADRFQLQPDDGEGWCVGWSRSIQNADGRSVSSSPSGPFSRTPASSSTERTL